MVLNVADEKSVEGRYLDEVCPKSQLVAELRRELKTLALTSVGQFRNNQKFRFGGGRKQTV